MATPAALYPDGLYRCAWVGKQPLYQRYHDQEWGAPVHDDRLHFEFLVLEAQQAGLSWWSVLQKREGYRRMFHNFQPERVAAMSQHELEIALHNPAVIRNRRKLKAAVTNAQAFLKLQRAFGSFDRYIWAFVEGSPVVNHWRTQEEVPVTTALSDRVSRDLKQRGFKFLGSITVYAHLQATGLVDDHLLGCWKRQQRPG